MANTGGTLAESGKPLFRAEAVDRFAAPERLDIAAAVVRPGTWLILWAAALVIVAALIAGLVLEAPSKVVGEGILLDAAGVEDAAATASGEIRDVMFHPGDHVNVGDVVAHLAQPDLTQDLDNATAELADAREELQKTVALTQKTADEQAAFHKKQADNLNESIGFGEQRVDILTEQLNGIQGLVDRGIIVKQKLIDVRNDLTQAREALANSRAGLQQIEVDATSQNAERERERLGLELKVDSAERKLAMIKERLGRVDVVTSAYKGVVAEVKMNPGEVIDRGGVILSIIPDPVANPGDDPVASLVATVYVDAADGKKVKLGMPVEVIPTVIRREEDGFVKGKVTYVSVAPATVEGITRVLKNKQLAQKLSNGAAPFEVRVELQADPSTPSRLAWSTSRGPNVAVTSGTPTCAEIIWRAEPVLGLIVPATKPYLNSLRPTLDRIRASIGL